MTLKLTIYHAGDRVPPLPGTDAFHSTELFHAYEATPGYRPLLVVAYENDCPVSKLLCTIRRSKRMSPPGIIWKGVVYGIGEYFTADAEKERLFAAMLQQLTQVALHEAFLMEFCNLPDSMFGYKAFRNNRYFPINWLKVRNSLHDTVRTEEGFSASRIRQIRKGLKNGAQVREAQTPEEIENFARMLHHVYSWKIRRHFPSRTFFYQIEKQMGKDGRSKTFIVTYKEKIIGGCVCTYSNDNAYLWFTGGMRKTYPLQYPGVLAVWKALDDAREHGYRHLEFMDVGLPFRKHGYRDFILRFGGKQTGTRRWFRFRWQWLNKLLSRFYD